ncbi:MAG: PspA/IM30 family protein [Gammaproteobacteria bacterium]|nr:PspA/IM30 family protein [Gammaproteobacteria bacterium]MCP5424315.1 PspA/IM30 family protein [Gammaproteobacteria bacterium]MCP5459068.1 PspA/IM30 family protein [Gammaproteobacteria bacterium]
MSSIIQRINDILKADLHHMIDQMEDPERMLKQIIRDTEEYIGEAKVSVVKALAAEKQLFNQLQENRAQSVAWADKAEYALRNGQEEMAKMALTRKFEYEQIADSLKPSWSSAKDTAQRLREQLKATEAKLLEMSRKRAALVARQRAAKAQQALSRTLVRFKSGLETQNNFVNIEERIAQAEAEAQAITEVLDEQESLEKAFATQQKELVIEEELAVLKQKIQIQPRKADWQDC